VLERARGGERGAVVKKSIAIIGAGIGGLAAGCYAQMRGYDSEIFEMHALPGGVCTSWKRMGYVFDGCIHHLPGCTPGNEFYQMWTEIGIMPGLEVLYADELVQVEDGHGGRFTVYTDLDRLANHVVLTVGAPDSLRLARWIMAMRSFAGRDLLEAVVGSPLDKLKALGRLGDFYSWGRFTMESFSEANLTDPFLRRAFPSILYDSPSNPLILQMNLLAGCASRSYGWPAGGSLAFARALERRYVELGGKVNYNARVSEVLVVSDRAVGVRLADGQEERADIVISNAFGHTTVMKMLDGHYMTNGLRKMYSRPVDDITMGLHVSLGVDRDMSDEPHALVLLLDEPVTIAGKARDRIAVDIYSFDPSMAPAGKAVVKVLLETSYRHWRSLSLDRERYLEAKQQVASAVIDLLEARFSGISSQVEITDVATPVTTERYTGITHPFKVPATQFALGSLTGNGISMTLPGLEHFYMVGQWAGLPGIPSVAAMARRVIGHIERRDRL
jgi:phytoene dehydrogenase-like protein